MSVIEAQWKDKLQLIHKNRIWIYSVAFLAARVEIAGMYPFAIAVYLAAYLADCGSWGVYGAVLLGICSTLSVFSAIKYGALMLLITIGILLIRSSFGTDKLQDREFYPLYSVLFSGLMVTVYGIMYRVISSEWNDWYMALLEGVLTVCFTMMLRQAYLTLHTDRDYLKSENIAGILVLLAVCLAGIPSGTMYYLDLLQLVSYYCILLLSYKYGSVYGIGTGIVCGVILAIRMQDVSWLAAGVLIGVTISFFRDWNRLLTVMGFLAVMGLLGFLYIPELFEAASIRSIIAAAVVYLLTPKLIIEKYWAVNETRDNKSVQSEMQKGLQDRIHNYAKVFRKMGNSMGEAGDSSADIPQYARQFREIGSSLKEFSESAGQVEPLEREQQAAVMKRFSREHVQIREMVLVKGIYGRKELYMSCRTVRGRVMTTKEAASILSEILKDNYRVSNNSRLIINRDYDVVIFEEDIRYRYLMGARRHIKDGQMVSGDNFSQMELVGGQVLMMLADGMGSGKKASEQSEQLVDLMEDMLDAGFRKETALRLMNELLTVKSGGETFATLDLCMVDLYTGVADFLKMGASITLIRRGSWVETIQSTSLPVGIQEETEPDGIQKKLYHGDRIIMVSDGLLDGIPMDDKEAVLQEMILGIHSNNPQELADELMSKVEAMNPDGMRDDASILVLGLWKK
ncbi:MAG: SpoIIE family protein phosphatase [Lachnospiraceae bacterium]|nr:SpoIIE family protein phosphatase [Lachnospiraceae bacterium]